MKLNRKMKLNSKIKLRRKTKLNRKMKQSRKMKSIAAVYLMSITLMLSLTSCITAKDKSYQVKETYRLYLAEGSKAYLMVDLPVSYGYQSIDGLTVNNADEYHFEQKDGYQILHAEVTGDGTEKTLEINYIVELFTGKHTWDMVNRDEYLKSYGNIDSDNQRIIEQALSLKVENDDYLTAKKILAYVSKTVSFDKTVTVNRKTLPASEILEQKTGVCTDYSNLATAMLRAAGIPSKQISGLVYNNLTEAVDWSHSAGRGSHAWVEFYADGKWHFADPTWGILYFDNSDGYHLSYGTELVDIGSDEYKVQFDDLAKTMEDEGYSIIGAMTAPLKFSAFSDDANTIIIPKATVERLEDSK